MKQWVQECREHWVSVIMDLVTMARSRKCPVCGGRVLLFSGDEVVSAYCEKCRSATFQTLMTVEEIDKTHYLALADEAGTREI